MLRAKRWGLPYREADAVTIDPAASELVDRENSNRLAALPLELREDGPVFAIVEPSEERFSAVRELVGNDASFIVVSQANFDLLSAEVYGVAPVSRRPSLFRGRGAREATRVETGQALTAVEAELPLPVTVVRPRRPATVVASVENEGNSSPPQASTASPEASTASPEATDPVESLIHQITAGTASLTAEVAQLTQSLDGAQRDLYEAQRELYEAREQLAEAQLANAGHDDIVMALRVENDELRRELAQSQSWNASITARLQNVAQALATPERAADQA